MVKHCKISLIFSILLSITGCLSNPVVPDHSCEKSTATELRDIDYLLFANSLVDELTLSKAVLQLSEKKRLNVYVDRLTNNTPEAINLQQIELAIKNRLKRSAKFNLQEDPAKSAYILSGAFNEKYSDCNDRINQFSMMFSSKSSKQLLWSQHKTYMH